MERAELCGTLESSEETLVNSTQKSDTANER